MQDLNIIYSNINSYSNKKSVINHFIQSNNISCALFVETKTKDNSAVGYRNWNVVHHPGNTLNTNLRGGSMIQLHPEIKLIKSNPVTINNPLNDCLHVAVPFTNDRLHIFLTYIHPTSLIEENIFSQASRCKYCIIIGDLNVNRVQKKRQLSRFLKTSNFEVYETEPTFIMPNNEDTTPDLILYSSNLKNNFKSVAVVPDLGSDHLAIQIKFDMQNTPIAQSNTPIYKFHKCDLKLVNEKMMRFIDETQEINRDHITGFNTNLSKIILDHTPKSESNFYSYELPPFIVKQIKLKRNMYREYIASKNHEIKRNLNELSKSIKNMVAQYNNHKWLQTCKEIDKSEGRKFYETVNKVTKYKTKLHVGVISEANKQFSTDDEKVNIFAQHFQKAFTPENNPQFDNDNKTFIDQWYDGYFRGNAWSENIEVSQQEYFEILAKQKTTAPGHDSIPWSVFKKLHPSIHKHIMKIFQYCFNNSYFPESWKLGNIVVLHKKNTDPTKVANYRPITLLPVMGKMFEKITRKLILDATSTHIPSYQYGFKEKHSTTHPLTILTSNIQTARLNNQHSAALFLDINKAFDSVWYKGLLYKLAKLDVPRMLIFIVRQFLENRKLKIKINNSFSFTFTPNQGVPQGSPLSPLLYNIYCHDMPGQTSRNGYTLLYADDTALVTHGRTVERTTEELQRLSLLTENWFKKWRLKHNPNKSQFIIFYHTPKPTSPTIDLGNVSVVPLTHIKYLGVQIDSKLNFKCHFNATKKRVISRAKYFRSLTYKTLGISISTASKLYKSICRPLLEYAHPVFINCRDSVKRTAQIAETSALRIITKMRHPSNPVHNPPNTLLYKRTRITPILRRLRNLNTKFARHEHNFRIITKMTISRANNRPKFKQPRSTLLECLNSLRNETN